MNNARQSLIRILQNAHAGELAAAYAYRGHWQSLGKSAAERERIRQIEREEWTHRREVGKWLKFLDAKPNKLKEAVFWAIGRSLGNACFVSGWFFPMYFAGRLESGNVQEYVDAANYAQQIGLDECAREMMEMSAVEAEHEVFFREIISNHRLLPVTRRFFRWS